MVTYLSYFQKICQEYIVLDIETGTQEIVGNFPGMTLLHGFHLMEKKLL